MGIFEGEGTFAISKRKDGRSGGFGCFVQVTQKDKTVLDKIKDLTGIGKIYQTREGKYSLYAYAIGDRSGIMSLIKVLFPHLQSSRTRRRAWCVYQMVKLRRKQKGFPKLSEEEVLMREEIYRKWERVKAH